MRLQIFFSVFGGLALCVPGLCSAGSTLRCVFANGGVVYQDARCPDGSSGAPVDDTPNSGFRFANRKDIERMRREQAASAAPIRPPRPTRALRAKAKTSGAERGLVKVGTRIFEVRRSIGAPNRIIRQSAENGKRLRPPASQRWVYLPVDDDPQVTILTVRNGRVLHVERKGPS